VPQRGSWLVIASALEFARNKARQTRCAGPHATEQPTRRLTSGAGQMWRVQDLGCVATILPCTRL